MNETTKSNTHVESAKHLADTVLSALSEVGSTWAVYGLKAGKMALAATSETLGKTASVLDVLATELAKKAPPADVAGPPGQVIEAKGEPVDAPPPAN